MIDHLKGALGIGVVAILAATTLGACISDQGYNYWILNDSDRPVLVDVRELQHRTLTVPAHTYGALLSGLGTPGEDWTINLVDERCGPLQSWPVDAAHDLVYIDPGGRSAVITDTAWGHGLRSATQMTLPTRTPVCP